MNKAIAIILLAVLLIVPLTGVGNYPLHLMIMGLLWAYVYTSWAIMGRLGMVSFGHGAFLGIGAYTVTMLWNWLSVSPWIGMLAAIAITLLVAYVIGYPCFRFKIVGHYFALVTLALSEVTRLVIVALRDITGGSLGVTPKTALSAGSTWSISGMQFTSKAVWFYIILACFLIGLYIWHRVDKSMSRVALEAISEEEDAAASIGIDVTQTKLRITMLSAVMTCIGGVLYAQYQQYINPETVSGIGVSLQMVFGVIAGGMFVMLGPMVGAFLLLALSESLRVLIGNQVLGVDLTIYGLLLIVFIIFMPKGILGSWLANTKPRTGTGTGIGTSTKPKA